MSDYKYFAFLDVLGYRNYLEADIKSASLGFKDKLQRAFRVFDDINSVTYGHKSISDSIFITGQDTIDIVELLKVLKKIHVNFIRCGLLLRGGVSFDSHFENGSITYSPALTRAYALEQEQAIYPRIVIDNSIIQKATNIGAYDRLKRSGLIIKTGDIHQIHIIDAQNWKSLYRAIKGLYEADRERINADSRLRAKYEWLHDYLFSYKPANATDGSFMQRWEKLT